MDSILDGVDIPSLVERAIRGFLTDQCVKELTEQRDKARELVRQLEKYNKGKDEQHVRVFQSRDRAWKDAQIWEGKFHQVVRENNALRKQVRALTKQPEKKEGEVHA